MKRVVLASVLAVLASACGGDRCPGADAPVPVAFRGATLTVRIAETPEERAHGLMGVTSLPSDEGMAFVYPSHTDESFWMKDTLIPLSVAFVDGDRIVTIRDMEPCTSDPCATYDPKAPYTYAVEANQGWFARHGIEEGDRVRSFGGPIHCQ